MAEFIQYFFSASVANPVVEGFKALVPYSTTTRELQDVITFEYFFIILHTTC